MFYRKSPMKRFGKEKKNSGERRKRKKKNNNEKEEKKGINEGTLWLEKCKEISPCCLNSILNSNHVQSDNEDDACALKSIFLYAFAHVHHSKSSYP